MTHQDQEKFRTIIEDLVEVFEQLVPIQQNYSVRHANAKFDTRWLAIVAIVCWGWTRNQTLAQRVVAAVAVANSVLGVDYSASRQGVQKALNSVGNELIPPIIDCFVNLSAKIKGHWSSQGKVNFAIDGTKFSAPRTKANQNYFSAKKPAKKQKQYTKKADASKASTVQLLVTTLWHIGTGLPYRWIVDGSSGSERKSLVTLIDTLPANARIIGDAEYFVLCQTCF